MAGGMCGSRTARGSSIGEAGELGRTMWIYQVRGMTGILRTVGSSLRLLKGGGVAKISGYCLVRLNCVYFYHFCKTPSSKCPASGNIPCFPSGNDTHRPREKC